MYLRFEWDLQKSRSNQIKHGVPFEEAQSVFYDEQAFEFYDPDHSDEEDRFLLLGLSERLRVLVVSYCLIENGIRIISARKATKREMEHYET